MFSFLGFIWVLLGALPLIITFTKMKKLDKNRIARRVKIGVIIFLLDIALLVILNVFLYYYTDILWFINLGFERRFLTFIFAQTALFGVGFAVAFVFLYANLGYSIRKLSAPRYKGAYLGGVFIIAIFHGIAASGLWYKYLLFANQVPGQVTDPLWHMSIGFYMFSLPFYTMVLHWVLWLIITALIINLVPLFVTRQIMEKDYLRSETFKQKATHLKFQWLFLFALVLFIYAAFSYLNIFKLMLGRHGVVSGVDYV
ncbi:MAG: UPF0182 family protein, partial [Spirochaetia bacterium]